MERSNDGVKRLHHNGSGGVLASDTGAVISERSEESAFAESSNQKPIFFYAQPLEETGAGSRLLRLLFLLTPFTSRPAGCVDTPGDGC